MRLYNVKKRENSTKLPTLDDYVGDVSLVWEQPYNTTAPQFKINGTISLNANYCYVPELKRYYWISSIDRYRRDDQYILTCKEDVLASYRDDILSTQAYVELSSIGYNSQIIDSRISCTSDTINETITQPIDGMLTQSAFAICSLQVLGAKTNGMGFGDCYLLAKRELGQIVKNALTDPDYFGAFYNALTRPVGTLKDFLTNFGDFIDQDGWTPLAYDIVENIRQPYDCFLSARLIPWSKDNFDGQNVDIEFAGVPMGTTGFLIGNGRSTIKSTTLDIPWIYTDFRNNSPYTTISLYFSGVGNIALDTSSLIGSSTITVEYILDAIEGAIAGVVKHEDGHILTTFGATLGVSMPIGQMQSGDILQLGTSLVSDLISGISAGASGNIGGALTSTLNYVNNVNSFIGQRTSGGGGIGSTVGVYDNNMRLTVSSSATLAPSTLNILGRPYRQTATLSALMGAYIQCVNASVQCLGTLDEITNINTHLNGGAWIE